VETPAATTRRSRSERETENAGRDLAARLLPGSTVRLVGDLGSGKTAFVRGLATGLGIDAARVNSPSYVLAIEHAGPRGVLLHVDLYRLPDGAGVDDLDIEETLVDGGIVAVEWGERLPAALAATAWTVEITITDSTRTICVRPPPAPRGHSTR
jgi:tRNA threonylcarbamoyladenosine biosynthesis protein TsaE